MYNWNQHFICFPKVYSSLLRFTSNVKKCNTISDVLASSQQQAVMRGKVIMLCCHCDNNNAHLICLQLVQIYKYINTQYGLPGKGEI